MLEKIASIRKELGLSVTKEASFSGSMYNTAAKLYRKARSSQGATRKLFRYGGRAFHTMAKHPVKTIGTLGALGTGLGAAATAGALRGGKNIARAATNANRAWRNRAIAAGVGAGLLGYGLGSSRR